MAVITKYIVPDGSYGDFTTIQDACTWLVANYTNGTITNILFWCDKGNLGNGDCDLDLAISQWTGPACNVTFQAMTPVSNIAQADSTLSYISNSNLSLTNWGLDVGGTLVFDGFQIGTDTTNGTLTITTGGPTIIRNIREKVPVFAGTGFRFAFKLVITSEFYQPNIVLANILGNTLVKQHQNFAFNNITTAPLGAPPNLAVNSTLGIYALSIDTTNGSSTTAGVLINIANGDSINADVQYNIIAGPAGQGMGFRYLNANRCTVAVSSGSNNTTDTTSQLFGASSLTGSSYTAIWPNSLITAGDYRVNFVNATNAAMGTTTPITSDMNGQTRPQSGVVYSGATIAVVIPLTTLTAVASGSDVVVTFTYTGATSFKVSRDGGAYATKTSPATYVGDAAGSHTYAVRAMDASGNVLGYGTGTYTPVATGGATANIQSLLLMGLV